MLDKILEILTATGVFTGGIAALIEATSRYRKSKKKRK